MLFLLILLTSSLQAIGPAPELPATQRSQTYVEKAEQAVKTGQIEAALKWYTQLPTENDKAFILELMLSTFQPKNLSDKQVTQLKTLVHSHIEGPALLDTYAHWRKVFFPPVAPIMIEPDIKGEQDIKEAVRPAGPKRPAPGLRKTIVLFAKNPVTKQQSEGFEVSRRLTTDARVSGLLKTSFEDANSVDAALDLRPDILRATIKYLDQVDQTIMKLGLTKQVNDPILQARNNKRVVDELIVNLKVDDTIFIELLRAALYLDSPLLLRALANRLFTAGEGKSCPPAGLLCPTALPEDEIQAIAHMDVADDIKRIIAQQYFLRGSGSIDRELGFSKLVLIPIEELIAYNKFSQSYVTAHPEMLTSKEARQSLFLQSIRESMLGIMIAFLRVKDISLNAPSDQLPLFIAIGRERKRFEFPSRRENTVKELIEAGAKVNIRGQNGNTPLTLAIKENHTELVPILLANGADPNFEQNCLGIRMTPLMVAITSHIAEETIKQLVDAGADTQAALERFKQDPFNKETNVLNNLQYYLSKFEKAAKK